VSVFFFSQHRSIRRSIHSLHIDFVSYETFLRSFHRPFVSVSLEHTADRPKVSLRPSRKCHTPPHQSLLCGHRLDIRQRCCIPIRVPRIHSLASNTNRSPPDTSGMRRMGQARRYNPCRLASIPRHPFPRAPMCSRQRTTSHSRSRSSHRLTYPGRVRDTCWHRVPCTRERRPVLLLPHCNHPLIRHKLVLLVHQTRKTAKTLVSESYYFHAKHQKYFTLIEIAKRKCCPTEVQSYDESE